MKVLKNKRKGYTVSLEIEESHDAIDGALDVAFKKYRKQAQLPGFRKGKLTRSMFEKHFGKEILMDDAINHVVNDAYRAAIEELELPVVDYPTELNVKEYKENQPIVFSLNVDVEPEVKLGKYKGVKVKVEQEKVTDEDVQTEIEATLDRFGEFGTVDEPAKAQDILRFHMKAKLDGVEYELWSRENAGCRLGLGSYGEAFDSELEGAKKDDKKQFSVSYADDFQNTDVAGKKVEFEIEVLDIRRKTLPELTDEFVKEKLDDDVNTVSELKASIRKKKEDELKQQNENKVREAVLDEVTDNSKMEVPKGMVDREVESNIRMLESQLRQSGLDLAKYAELMQKDIEGMKEEMRPTAETRVKRGLAVKAIREKEKIEATDEDVNAEIEKWNSPKFKSIDDLKSNAAVHLDDLRASIAEDKTIKMLVSNAKIS
ncbi:MAG: trigger factor [bacterium]|nr:trigger factor [bacterium]